MIIREFIHSWENVIWCLPLTIRIKETVRKDLLSTRFIFLVNFFEAKNPNEGAIVEMRDYEG